MEVNNLKFYGFRLLVNDFNESVRFYKDVLEIPVEWNLEDVGYANRILIWEV